MAVANTAVDGGKRVIGFFSIFIGDVNTTPTSLIGFIDRSTGLDVNPTQDEAELLVTAKSGPLNIDVTTERIEVTVEMVQFQATPLALSLGKTENGQVVTGGGAPAITRQLALRITGTNADGTAYQLDVPSCVAQPNGSRVFTPDAHGKIPIIFKGQDHGDNTEMFTETVAGGNVVATLATNILTRVLNTPETFHRVAAQADTSPIDTIDTIVDSADFVDNEFLTLQADTGDTITVSNNATGANTIDLTGTDDVILTGVNTLKLQYDLVGTEWNEVSRFIVQ